MFVAFTDTWLGICCSGDFCSAAKLRKTLKVLDFAPCRSHSGRNSTPQQLLQGFNFVHIVPRCILSKKLLYAFFQALRATFDIAGVCVHTLHPILAGGSACNCPARFHSRPACSRHNFTYFPLFCLVSGWRNHLKGNSKHPSLHHWAWNLCESLSAFPFQNLASSTAKLMWSSLLVAHRLDTYNWKRPPWSCNVFKLLFARPSTWAKDFTNSYLGLDHLSIGRTNVPDIPPFNALKWVYHTKNMPVS